MPLARRAGTSILRGWVHLYNVGDGTHRSSRPAGYSLERLDGSPIEAERADDVPYQLAAKPRERMQAPRLG